AGVRVELTPTAGGVRLRVSDDGAGFDPRRVERDTGGFGLRGMRERVAQVGGTLTVQSEPGAGTTVQVEVPR
ncbi:MAG: sensor histidine kinase, partial [Thermocrispum sp.]